MPNGWKRCKAYTPRRWAPAEGCISSAATVRPSSSGNPKSSKHSPPIDSMKGSMLQRRSPARNFFCADMTIFIALRSSDHANQIQHWHRNQDSSFANLNTSKQQVGTDLGVEVRLRKWY